MTQRALFVCSAKSVPVLDHGRDDCDKIVKTLTDPRFGGTSVSMPLDPLIDCATKGEFLKALADFVEASQEAEQRILYFTGHGRSEGGQYAFEFDGSQSLPFSVAAGLLAPSGARRTVFIVDSCYAGGAAAHGLKSSPEFFVSAGSCVLASCKAIELSREMPGHGSLFTAFFCEGIENGLGGKKTPLGRISVTDILGYVKAKLEPYGESALTKQTPNYSVTQAEDPFWIATNISGVLEEYLEPPKPKLDIDPHALPPDGARYADLNEEAILAFARRDPLAPSTAFEAARHLGLLFAQDDDRPSAAAILCFGKAPQRFFPNIASVFSAGDKAGDTLVSEEVEGTLVEQFERLDQLLRRHLDRKSTFQLSGQRSDRYEIDPKVLREVLANALTHRDFAGRGRVQVHIDDDHIEILNPGRFPPGHDWESLLRRPGKSLTDNRRIANYLRKLQKVEGHGRGFHIFKQFRARQGDDAIRFEQEEGVVTCYIKRPEPSSGHEPQAVTEALERETEMQLADAMQRQTQMLTHVKVLGTERPFPLEQIFVHPVLGDERGNEHGYAELVERLAQDPGFRALLVGSAGMGKSMLLRKIAIELSNLSGFDAQVAGDDVDGASAAVRLGDPLVFYFALRNLNNDLPLVAALAQQLGTFPTALDRAIRTRRTVLLLDGFDEVVPEQRAQVGEQIAQLVYSHPALSILVSSRPIEQLHAVLPESLTLAIKPFTRTQVLQLFELGRPGTFAELAKQLPDDSPILTNPLLAQIAGLTLDQYGEIPESRQRIMSMLVETMMQRHDATKGMFRRTLALGFPDMLRTMRAMALAMVLHGMVELREDEAMNLVGSAAQVAVHDLGTMGPSEHRRILDEMVELGFFHRNGLYLMPFHRSIIEHLAVEGAVQTIREPQQFARVLARLLRDLRALPLAIDFLDGWVQDRAQAQAVLDFLREERTRDAGESATLLDRLIADLDEKLPGFGDPPSDLFGLLGQY